MASDQQELSRRRFLRETAFGTLGLASTIAASCARRESGGREVHKPAPTAPPAAVTPPAPPSSDKSRVVIARHSGLTSGGEVQEDALADTVDRALMELTGETAPEKAWQRHFSSDETIGIKVNGLGGPQMATSVLLSKICVERLHGIGVKPEKIIFWDSNRGFLSNCGLDQEVMWGAQVLTMDVEWDRVHEQGSFRGPLTAILTKRVDGYLNLPILKDHSIAGITLAMKNHYGSHANPGDHHGNYCDPFIADLNSIPAIRDKQRLILCDGTRGQAQGGPGYNPQYAWNPNLILAATDPVAHDTVGWEIIEAKRRELGLQPIMGGAQPPQLRSAAKRGLGTNDLTKIDKLEIGVA